MQTKQLHFQKPLVVTEAICSITANLCVKCLFWLLLIVLSWWTDNTDKHIHIGLNEVPTMLLHNEFWDKFWQMDTISEPHWRPMLFVNLKFEHRTESMYCRLLASPTICTLTLPHEWYVTQNRSGALIASVCSESRLLYLIFVLWRSGWWWRWLSPCQGCYTQWLLLSSPSSSSSSVGR